MQDRVILGIDPALSKTGWAIIKKTGKNTLKYIASGVISTKMYEVHELHKKILYISKQLEAIIVKFSPEEVAVEETYVNLNPRTSLKLGVARGAILLTIMKNIEEIVEYTPRFVKKTIAGNGNAEKLQVSFMVKTLLGENSINFVTEDESDAVAIAITHALCSQMKNLRIANG